MNNEAKTNEAVAEQHVVLGAGQVGGRLAARLVADGHRVRVVRRSEGVARVGVERVRADMSVEADAIRACAGATVVYDCTNPQSYGSWDTTLAPLKRGVVKGVEAAGARLVALDNLYMYGRPDGALTEDTPMQPCSHKGELRARLSRELAERAEAGGLDVAVGRASDFFGPGSNDMSLFGTPAVARLGRGFGAFVPGDPDLPRSYSYVPDVVAGLATLGAQPLGAGHRVFHLPVAHQGGTTRELVERLAKAHGVSPRLVAVPRWVFRMAGWFSRDAAAMTEMIYQWETPYVLDDTRFVQTFGVAATPIERAVEESVEASRPARAALPMAAPA